MVVARVELDVELDPAEERRRRREGEPVDARLERGGELANAPSASVSPAGTGDAVPEQLHLDSRRRPAGARVEDVGREGDAHAANSRLLAMLAGDVVLVRVDETAVAHDVAPADDEPVDAVRQAQHPAGDRILRACELEAVESPDGEVGSTARLERADVVAAEDLGASTRREAERVAGGQRLGTAAAARDQQRLLHLEAEVAALVRRRAVHAEPDAHTRVEHLANRRHARAQPQVRRRAVRDTHAVLAERRNVGLVQMDAVGAPDAAFASQPRSARYSTGRQP